MSPEPENARMRTLGKRPRDYDATDAYIAARMAVWTEELMEFCSIPSEAEDSDGLRRARDWTLGRLHELGCSVDSIGAEDAATLVVGEIGEGRILTCVQHYDVQPAAPLDLWTSPPYEPAIRDGALFARGAEDNKGEFLARVWAIEAYLAVIGPPPCRIRFLVEGEEEIGSPHLAGYLNRRPELREAAGALMEGGGIDDQERPIIQCGIRGMLVVELTLRTIAYDGHSSIAALLPNAAIRMSQAIASLFDTDGHPSFAGLRDDVLPPTPEQLELVDAIPDELLDMLRHAFEIDRFVGARTGNKAKRTAILEPTCNVSGLWSGYTLAGIKTITPAEAHARLDLRLVPDQDPDEVIDRLREHFQSHGFGELAVAKLAWGNRAYWSSPKASIVEAAARALESVWGSRPTILVTDPGTAPMWDICAANGVPQADFGAAHSGSRAHAPNESIRLDYAEKGVRSMVRFIDEFASSAG
jgi:acetylornithine deacetylase/succinyl-diaminopimelate desuccinylase-like protein